MVATAGHGSREGLGALAPHPSRFPSPRPPPPPPGPRLTVAVCAYFDAASAAPLHPVGRQALLAALDEGWADPARLYREGRRARLLLDAAREAAAEAVECRPDELVFTPSGTRAVHAGIEGALAGRRRVGRHLIVSAVEHSSVLHTAEVHEALGGVQRHRGAGVDAVPHQPGPVRVEVGAPRRRRGCGRAPSWPMSPAMFAPTPPRAYIDGCRPGGRGQPRPCAAGPRRRCSATRPRRRS
ncbi:Cysteine desulfurase IscS [Streptomyces hirsutus]